MCSITKKRLLKMLLFNACNRSQFTQFLQGGLGREPPNTAEDYGFGSVRQGLSVKEAETITCSGIWR